MTTKHPTLFRASLVCLLAAAFYLYEFILQVSVGVTTAPMMQSLHINAYEIGIIAACFFASYTPTQLFAGILYDKFSARWLLVSATSLCALGAVCFGLSTSMWLACLGRLMMGIGSAFSFIGTLLLIGRWFDAKYFAMLAGLAQFMSAMGAIGGETPLQGLLGIMSWQHAMIFLGSLGFGLAILIALVVRDYPAGKVSALAEEKQSVAKLFSNMKSLFNQSQVWMVALYSFAIWGPVIGFAGVWLNLFFVQTHHVTATMATYLSDMVWLGYGVGSPVVGAWSNRMGRRKPFLTGTALVMAIACGLFFYVPTLPLPLLFVLLFLFGAGAGGQVIAFAVLNDFVDRDIAGTAMGFNNMAVVAGGFVFQMIIGKLLDLHWHHLVVQGIRVYDLLDYQHAFTVLFVCSLAAVLLGSFAIHETFCRQANDR